MNNVGLTRIHVSQNPIPKKQKQTKTEIHKKTKRKKQKINKHKKYTKCMS